MRQLNERFDLDEKAVLIAAELYVEYAGKVVNSIDSIVYY